jgi:LuxR family maltose regulon positive regulatory protein
MVGMSADTSLVAPQVIVSALINELAEIDDDTFLVLDDYHLLGDPVIHDAVSFLVTHAPENFHLVLTTRVQPPLPLARLMAHGELLEIDATALRFDADETRQFLEQACEGRLGHKAIARLHATTEGWVAALRIAASSILRGSGKPARCCPASRPIAAYIGDMLASLPEEAVASRSGARHPDGRPVPCSDRVPASAEMLEYGRQGCSSRWTARAVVSLPSPLDYLRLRLQERHGRITPLHRRAFARYAEHEL